MRAALVDQQSLERFSPQCSKKGLKKGLKNGPEKGLEYETLISSGWFKGGVITNGP